MAEVQYVGVIDNFFSIASRIMNASRIKFVTVGASTQTRKAYIYQSMPMPRLLIAGMADHTQLATPSGEINDLKKTFDVTFGGDLSSYGNTPLTYKIYDDNSCELFAGDDLMTRSEASIMRVNYAPDSFPIIKFLKSSGMDFFALPQAIVDAVSEGRSKLWVVKGNLAVSPKDGMKKRLPVAPQTDFVVHSGVMNIMRKIAAGDPVSLAVKSTFLPTEAESYATFRSGIFFVAGYSETKLDKMDFDELENDVMLTIDYDEFLGLLEDIQEKGDNPPNTPYAATFLLEGTHMRALVAFGQITLEPQITKTSIPFLLERGEPHNMYTVSWLSLFRITEFVKASPCDRVTIVLPAGAYTPGGDTTASFDITCGSKNKIFPSDSILRGTTSGITQTEAIVPDASVLFSGNVSSDVDAIAVFAKKSLPAIYFKDDVLSIIAYAQNLRGYLYLSYDAMFVGDQEFEHFFSTMRLSGLARQYSVDGENEISIVVDTQQAFVNGTYSMGNISAREADGTYAFTSTEYFLTIPYQRFLAILKDFVTPAQVKSGKGILFYSSYVVAASNTAYRIVDLMKPIPQAVGIQDKAAAVLLKLMRTFKAPEIDIGVVNNFVVFRIGHLMASTQKVTVDEAALERNVDTLVNKFGKEPPGGVPEIPGERGRQRRRRLEEEGIYVSDVIFEDVPVAYYKKALAALYKARYDNAILYFDRGSVMVGGYNAAQKAVTQIIRVPGSRSQGSGASIGILLDTHLDSLPQSSKTMTIEVGNDGNSMRYTGDLGEMYFVNGLPSLTYDLNTQFTDSPLPSRQDINGFLKTDPLPNLLPTKR